MDWLDVISVENWINRFINLMLRRKSTIDSQLPINHGGFFLVSLTQ